VTIRLLIADDHVWIRDGLRALFQPTEIEIVAEATTGEEAVSLALASDVDVVLLDIKMPQGNGLDALTRIRAVKQQLPMVIYSAHDRLDFYLRCKTLGVSAHLQKGANHQEVIEAVRSAFEEYTATRQVTKSTNSQSRRTEIHQ
jgi:DNA-binding NarL/FixJ family response regulator